MQSFIQKHSKFITGILSGFDRLVFRGFLRSLNYPGGMHAYLSATNISFNDFAKHVEITTRKVKDAAMAPAERYKRPLVYLPSSEISKEELAKNIVRKDGIEKGLVCVLTAVEPCTSIDLHRNRKEKKVELIFRRRKCHASFQRSAVSYQRIHERSYSNMVPVHHTNMYQWSAVALTNDE